MKKLVELSPLIGAFLVFTGFLRLYLVYQHWDIRIVDYLDFSEILLSFLHDLNVVVLCLAIFIFHQLIGFSALEFADRRSKGLVFAGLEEIITKHWLALLISSTLAAVGFTIIFYKLNDLLWLYLAIASWGQSIFIGIDRLFEANGNLGVGVAIVMTFLLLTCFLARRDIVMIEQESPMCIWTIETDDDIISTTNTFFLLGKTQKFIFLHDSKDHSTRIIAVDRVKSMVVRQ